MLEAAKITSPAPDFGVLFRGIRKAPYKIELYFGKGRTATKAYGLLLCWESGKALHGGGDVLMFLCGYSECNRFFLSDCVSGSLAVCPWCQRAQYASGKDRRRMMAKGHPKLPQMYDKEIFSGPLPFVAERITQRFQELSQNHEGQEGGADIYLKYAPKDLRGPSLGGDTMGLELAQTTIVPVIYPLVNIIKDTAGGKDLQDCFLSLLKA